MLLFSAEFSIFLLKLHDLPSHFFKKLGFLVFTFDLLCKFNYFILEILNNWILQTIADLKLRDLLDVPFLLKFHNMDRDWFLDSVLTLCLWECHFWIRNWAFQRDGDFVLSQLSFQLVDLFWQLKVVFKVFVCFSFPIKTVVFVFCFGALVAWLSWLEWFHWFKIFILERIFLPRGWVSIC